MRLLKSAMCATVVVGLLPGCSGNMSSSPSSSVPSNAGSAAATHGGSYLDGSGRFVPVWSRLASAVPIKLMPKRPMRLNGRVAPDSEKTGIYVGAFFATDIYGYHAENEGNGPATCTESGASNVNDIAVDGVGDLIVPNGGTRQILVYKGKKMCGALKATISDPYGQPSDAAARHALTGRFAVANIFDTSGAGSISLCTISGCTANLTNSNMYEVAGVAMDKHGNCWADATNATGVATLTYFEHCSGGGVAATGFNNTYYGGLDIDKAGNLVAISSSTPSVTVYAGCKPACTLVGGPFSLHGESIYGHLNKKSNAFVAADYQNGEIDIYRYSPHHLIYKYSFNNGLAASLDVEGVAVNPRSKE